MKARDGDRARSLALCEALGAGDRGELIQRDTYFNVAIGRLKLREERDAAAHLISYVRAESASPDPIAVNAPTFCPQPAAVVYFEVPLQVLEVLNSVIALPLSCPFLPNLPVIFTKP